MASNSTNNGPKVVNTHTGAFFGAAVAFLAATGVWNLANIWLLNITAQEQWMLGMGVLSAMFATVVVGLIHQDYDLATLALVWVIYLEITDPSRPSRVIVLRRKR